MSSYPVVGRRPAALGHTIELHGPRPVVDPVVAAVMTNVMVFGGEV